MSEPESYSGEAMEEMEGLENLYAHFLNDRAYKIAADRKAKEVTVADVKQAHAEFAMRAAATYAEETAERRRFEASQACAIATNGPPYAKPVTWEERNMRMAATAAPAWWLKLSKACRGALEDEPEATINRTDG